MPSFIYFQAPKRFFAFCLAVALISSCSNYGRFVKLFHIRGQHYVPTYVIDKPIEKIKSDFEKLFSDHSELLLTEGQTNDYAEGKYFAHIKDSVSKKAFMIRFAVDQEKLLDSTFCVLKIFSIKYPKDPEWVAFFSHKTSAKKLKQIDVLAIKYLFSKIPQATFTMIPNNANGYTVFKKKNVN
jgi:hypothetical protein